MFVEVVELLFLFWGGGCQESVFLIGQQLNKVVLRATFVSRQFGVLILWSFVVVSNPTFHFLGGVGWVVVSTRGFTKDVRIIIRCRAPWFKHGSSKALASTSCLVLPSTKLHITKLAKFVLKVLFSRISISSLVCSKDGFSTLFDRLATCLFSSF